jgi:hypothetical protein
MSINKKESFNTDLINLFHQPICFIKSNNDLLIMLDFFETQNPSLAVFKPFLCRLVTYNDQRHAIFLGSSIRGTC